MNSVITKSFEIGKSDKLEIPRTKAGQKLIVKKIHINRIDDTGVIVAPDNLEITLKINSWPVLDKYSGTLLSNNPNTVVLNHEFDADDDIKLDVNEIVASVGTSDKVLLTMIIEYIK